MAELILVVGIIVQIIVLTPIFCEDKELGTDKLIYSTAKGRVKDYTARVLVVLSITVGINLILRYYLRLLFLNRFLETLEVWHIALLQFSR